MLRHGIVIKIIHRTLLHLRWIIHFCHRSLNGSNPVKIEADPNDNSHHNVSNLIKREQTAETDCDRDYDQTSGITGDVRAEDLSMPDHVSSHIMDS